MIPDEVVDGLNAAGFDRVGYHAAWKWPGLVNGPFFFDVYDIDDIDDDDERDLAHRVWNTVRHDELPSARVWLEVDRRTSDLTTDLTSWWDAFDDDQDPEAARVDTAYALARVWASPYGLVVSIYGPGKTVEPVRAKDRHYAYVSMVFMGASHRERAGVDLLDRLADYVQTEENLACPCCSEPLAWSDPSGPPRADDVWFGFDCPACTRKLLVWSPAEASVPGWVLASWTDGTSAFNDFGAPDGRVTLTEVEAIAAGW